MASTNKTSLGLNMWEASDKPVRQDFVNDNKIIDERIAKLNSDLTTINSDFVKEGVTKVRSGRSGDTVYIDHYTTNNTFYRINFNGASKITALQYYNGSNLSTIYNSDIGHLGSYVYSSINAATYTGANEQEIAWVTIPTAGTWLVGFKLTTPINFVLKYGDDVACLKDDRVSPGSASAITPLVITEGGKKLSLKIVVLSGTVTTTNDSRFDRIFAVRVK